MDYFTDNNDNHLHNIFITTYSYMIIASEEKKIKILNESTFKYQ